MWATCKQRAELGPGEGAKEVCRCHLSLVLNSGRRPAVVVKILSRRALGTGQRAEETQKKISKKNGTAHKKKKKVMGALKKKHGRPMGAAPMK